MHRTLLAMLFSTGLALAAPPAGRAAEPDAAQDERLLAGADLPTDGTGLLQFFRRRTEGSATPAKVAALIERLGVGTPSQRRAAAAELIALGPEAVPLLRQAARDPDVPAVAARARRCLEALEGRSSALTAAAVRQLVRRRPAGTVEALLAYLPAAEDDAVREEVQSGLVALAHPGGKPNPVLLKALADKLSIRRAAAVVALCRGGVAEPRETLRKLLKDPAPTVRLRASLALARAGEAKAVSTLITLLPEVGPEQAREVDDYLTGLAAELAPAVSLGDSVAVRERCRDAWAAWWLASEGPGPLEEVRKRTLTDADRTRAADLVKKLGDDDFETREQAEAELKKMGPRVASLVEQAAQGRDVEVTRRARAVLAVVGKDTAPPLSPVTIRLLALRQPAGAAAALLAFLPFADDEGLASEVQGALNTLAYRGGKPDPALLRGLADKVAVRRAAAAEALCQGPFAPHRAALFKLLKDPEASVRLRAALALAGAREREAVPVLIALVGEMPSADSAPAEEYLARVAGGARPAALPAGDAGRAKRRAAWAAWWDAHGDRATLVAARPWAPVARYYGYTLLVQPNFGRVVELDRSGKTRWTLNGLGSVYDARVVGRDRVLLAEYSARRVSERNLKGAIVWQAAVPSWPVGAQRLPNGNTFVTCRDLLLEVDRRGREVSRVNRPHDVLDARKMKDGTIVCVTNSRLCLRLDRTGKELKRFPLHAVFSHGIDIRPNGHVVVPGGWTNKVIEYDAAGKVVAEVAVTQAMSAFRLPNGHYLVSTQQWPQKVVEVDKTGKVVAEVATNQYTTRVRRR